MFGNVLRNHLSAFQFHGRYRTSVPMSRLLQLLQPLDGSEVKVTAQLVDERLQVTEQGHSATRVYGDTIQLKFLGGPSQVFRAHMPFRAHVSGEGEGGRG